MVAKPQNPPPTLADLDALPKGVKGEIIEGVLYAMTRPRTPHQGLIAAITSELYFPFQRGRGGPGGWWILPEPGIELPNTPEISPDVTGWRKERVPSLPIEHAMREIPDWVCEILSPSTEKHNLFVKKPYYAKIGVQHLWIVDRARQALTAYRLQNGLWAELRMYSEETEARIEPFDAVPLDVSTWWATT